MLARFKSSENSCSLPKFLSAVLTNFIFYMLLFVTLSVLAPAVTVAQTASVNSKDKCSNRLGRLSGVFEEIAAEKKALSQMDSELVEGIRKEGLLTSPINMLCGPTCIWNLTSALENLLILK